LKIKVMEEIYSLSNRYYEIMPPSDSSASFGKVDFGLSLFIPPITDQNTIDKEYKKLRNLTEIGIISKIFFGALSQQKKINPVDYLLDVFDIKFEILNK